MEVIFIKDLKGQGKKGKIKEVKAGYGINYLIKNGYALIANEANKKHIIKEQEHTVFEESKQAKEASEKKERLEKTNLKFKVKTGLEDKVFGSISAKQISCTLQEIGFDIDKKNIELDRPLLTLGFHLVKINLYKKIYATIKVELIK